MGKTLKIYTKTGDKGQTSLFGGTRVSKAHLRVEAYGTMDELHAAIGLAKSFLKKKKPLDSLLTAIQIDLFALCSSVATPSVQPVSFIPARLEEIEKTIDQLTETLPELKNFIFFGGSQAGASLHLARTICRRVERRLVALHEQEAIDANVMKYFNRLSDFLFTVARYANFIEKKKETIWKKSDKT